MLTGCMSILPTVAPKVSHVENGISSEFLYQSQFASVLGSKMHYVEEGKGDPILLVHGNPTSGYLWRNIIPHLKSHGRVIAVDLIGMGQSGKPDINYRFADHAKYLSAFIDELGLTNTTLVLHDWGGALGLDYAARNSKRIKRIALMEAVVKPASWQDTNLIERFIFKQFRGQESGDKLNIDQNYFIEKALPMFVGRKLSEAELSAYRRPYLKPEDRQPVAQWAREIPIDGQPADNHKRIGTNYKWLKKSDVPVLLLQASPGAILKQPIVDQLKQDIPRLDVRSIGPGLHFIQETTPRKIGQVLSDWLSS